MFLFAAPPLYNRPGYPEWRVITEWSMPRRRTPARCEHPFEPERTSSSFIMHVKPARGMDVADYCLTCSRPATRRRSGSWKTRRPEPSARKALRFDPEAIYGLFERLEDVARARQVQLRFVLALLLWRKRRCGSRQLRRAAEGEIWEVHEHEDRGRCNVWPARARRSTTRTAQRAARVRCWPDRPSSSTGAPERSRERLMTPERAESF